MKQIEKNTLFYGDNLKILREYIPSESIDLIYLDPPFNSNRNYNVLYKDESGNDSEAQITAFEDTWHWDRKAQETYHELVTDAPEHITKMISALKDFIGANQVAAYLVMMTVRLIELHRVLKSTGSLYLHCDPTMSHYLKIVTDIIFGARNFRNEIIWQRKTGRGDTGGTSKRFGNMTDILLFYGKSDQTTFNPLYRPNDPKYIEKFFNSIDENGRHYAADNLASPNPRPNLTYEYKGYKPPAYGWAVSKEKMKEMDASGLLIFPKNKEGRIRRKRYLDKLIGEPVQNIWDDIPALSALHAERLDYPTQKPVGLLERIINASSNKGDTVLDPFCGCGTAIHAAEKLNRKWIGIDITHLSTSLMKYRLKDAFNLIDRKDYDVIGEPEDLSGAEKLAQENRYQFQWWALSLVQAKPVGGVEKKGKDKGIDGVINFIDDNSEKAKRVIVQVKSGKVGAKDIRDLSGTVEHEKAQMGIFITLNEPTKDMKTASAEAGFYHSFGWNKDYRKIQIMTIERLMNGETPELPPIKRTFKRAKRDIREQDKSKQNGLF